MFETERELFQNKTDTDGFSWKIFHSSGWDFSAPLLYIA